MARGGQLFTPAPQPTNWLKIALYVVGALAAAYLIYRAFFRACPSLSPKKEKFGGDCPCNKNRSSGFFLL